MGWHERRSQREKARQRHSKTPSIVARAEDIRNKVLIINAPTKRTAARFTRGPMQD